MPDTKIIDRCTGVIREIYHRQIYCSLFAGEDEYSIKLDKKAFRKARMPLRENEAFRFWVEKRDGIHESYKVEHLPRRELTTKERKEIAREIEGLLS